MVDWVCLHWTETDEGIWEVRGGQQHFVYSKVMAWVCLDRGIRLAERRSFPADLPRWLQVRNQIYEEIQEKGWNKKRKAFVQYYGSDTLDASVLVMPLVFFMSPTDPRFVSTLDAILASVADDGLVSNNLVFRSAQHKHNKQHERTGLVGEHTADQPNSILLVSVAYSTVCLTARSLVLLWLLIAVVRLLAVSLWCCCQVQCGDDPGRAGG